MSNPFTSIKPRKYEAGWHELLAALIKANGIHEGRWCLTFTFTNNLRHMTVNGQMCPATISILRSINIERVDDEAPLNDLTVDAAEVNPKPLLVVPVLH